MFLYPFGDFHSLNLGWFLLQFKDWVEKIQEYLDNGGGTAENLANVIAPVFNAENSYAADDYVLYNDVLYKANRAVTPGTWDPDAWDSVLIVDEMGSGGGSTGVDNVARLMIAGQYSPSFAYQKYGICRYNDKLWMCNTDLPAGGEAWNAAHWDEITVGAGLSGLRRSADTLANEIVNLNSAINSAITKDNSSYVGGAAVTITGDRQTFTTDIDLVAGKQYLIVRKSDINNTNYIRCFSGGTTSNHVDINAPKYLTTFTPNTSGKLTLYSRGSYTNYQLEIAVFVYDNPDIVLHDEIYFVDKSGYYDGSYTSLTQCFLDLKNNTNNKTIFVLGGDYDIYQEYVDANVPVYTGDDPMTDYFNYNVWIPTNSHVIGLGLVRLIWQPTTTQATYNQSRTVSPVNVAGSMILENVEIYCKNGRYCIHDDAGGQYKYNRSIKRYINVKCYKLPNDSNYGTIHTIGMGIDREQYYVFEHCLFNNTASGNSFYAHSRQTVGVALTINNSSNLLLDDCIFNSSGSPCVRFVNSNNVTDQLIRVSIDNCTFTQAMRLEGTPNKFLVTLNNSGAPTINIDDVSNTYSPIIFNASYAGGRSKAEFKAGLDLTSAFAAEMLQILGTVTGDGTNNYYVSNNYRGVWFVLADANMSAIIHVMVSSSGSVTLAVKKFNEEDTTLTFSTDTRKVSITSTTTANLTLVPFTINGSKTYRQDG